MNKRNNTIFLINGYDLHKSKYQNVNIIKYTPKEEHPEYKCTAIVSFEEWKYIEGDNEEDIKNTINEIIKGGNN